MKLIYFFELKFLKFCLFVYFLLLSPTFLNAYKQCLVKTSSAKIHGASRRSILRPDKKFCGFLGLPFGQLPVREYRSGRIRRTKRQVRNLGSRKEESKSGIGIFDALLDVLPFSLHIPGYEYLGVGAKSKIEEKLKNDVEPMNKLDELARLHDIQYIESRPDDYRVRQDADRDLEKGAWKRVVAPDADVWERFLALLTTNAMKFSRWVRRLGSSPRRGLNSRKSWRQATHIRKKRSVEAQLVGNEHNIFNLRTIGQLILQRHEGQKMRFKRMSRSPKGGVDWR